MQVRTPATVLAQDELCILFKYVLNLYFINFSISSVDLSEQISKNGG